MKLTPADYTGLDCALPGIFSDRTSTIEKYVKDILSARVYDKDIFDDTRAVTEPAGALAIAGMKKYVREHGLTGKTLISVVTGADINFHRLRHISERTELGEKRDVVLAATIDEKPCSFRHFSMALGQRNITEFNYRYDDPLSAKIFVGIEISDAGNGRRDLLAELDSKHFKVVDMSDNEAAKLHIRHMVGGRTHALQNERVFRFEFPERPGALMKFLDLLGGRWNISMFHYRNHGADYGRVLVDMQGPESEMKQFAECLETIGYRYWDGTDNVAYKTFVAPA
jgi:threonine dehydratase